MLHRAIKFGYRPRIGKTMTIIEIQNNSTPEIVFSLYFIASKHSGGSEIPMKK